MQLADYSRAYSSSEIPSPNRPSSIFPDSVPGIGLSPEVAAGPFPLSIGGTGVDKVSLRFLVFGVQSVVAVAGHMKKLVAFGVTGPDIGVAESWLVILSLRHGSTIILEVLSGGL